ncbi:YheC/YheD family protein [Virgibacillus natechei]
MHSKTIKGDPFDCQIRLEKIGKRKWEVVINLVRIGTGQKVASNIMQGGSISTLEPFLKSNYLNKWEPIRDSIIEVGKTFPSKIEELYNQELHSMGIDVGIDKYGKLYLFESNNAPGVDGAWGEIAMVKCDYYKYMLDELPK